MLCVNFGISKQVNKFKGHGFNSMNNQRMHLAEEMFLEIYLLLVFAMIKLAL